MFYMADREFFNGNMIIVFESDKSISYFRSTKTKKLTKYQNLFILFGFRDEILLQKYLDYLDKSSGKQKFKILRNFNLDEDIKKYTGENYQLTFNYYKYDDELNSDNKIINKLISAYESWSVINYFNLKKSIKNLNEFSYYNNYTRSYSKINSKPRKAYADNWRKIPGLGCFYIISSKETRYLWRNKDELIKFKIGITNNLAGKRYDDYVTHSTGPINVNGVYRITMKTNTPEKQITYDLFERYIKSNLANSNFKQEWFDLRYVDLKNLINALYQEHKIPDFHISIYKERKEYESIHNFYLELNYTNKSNSDITLIAEYSFIKDKKQPYYAPTLYSLINNKKRKLRHFKPDPVLNPEHWVDFWDYVCNKISREQY